MNIRTLLVAASIATSMSLRAQPRMTPDLDRVTIFSKGAQVYRHKQVALRQGEQTLCFTGLSPYIDMKSLQIKAQGNVTVLGISHRFVLPDSAMLTRQVRNAAAELKKAHRLLAEVQKRREALQAQLDMVKTNSSTAARTVATPLEAIRQLNQYYYDETMAINKRLLAVDDEEQQASDAVRRRQETLDSLAGIKMKRLSVVDVKVDARQSANATFTFSYYVEGASWYPTYDLRSSSTKAPLELTYKANITQQTNEDWRNVPVTLSSANPNRSNVAPDLKTYWLDYGLAAPTYDFGIDNNSISGTITDTDGEPVIGATVRVKGTTIGTVSDMDGRYTLTLPNNNRNVEASFVGMVSQEKRATGSRLDFRLEDDNMALQEVVVTGYGSRNTNAKVRFTSPVLKKDAEIKAEAIEDENAMDVATTAAKFGYEFAIGHPLTILSDNKPVSCQIGRYSLPATYAYRGVPKIDKDAFLVADATGWDDLNLIQGEANVFFDNCYVGKTILDPNQQSDTLNLSMGRDNGIRIERKLIKNSSGRKFMGSSRVQTMNWEISVRNSRAEPVSINIHDQIPVSRNPGIAVTPLELGNGQFSSADGRIVWTLNLAPGETRRLTFSYRVKCDKNRRLDIE